MFGLSPVGGLSTWCGLDLLHQVVSRWVAGKSLYFTSKPWEITYQWLIFHWQVNLPKSNPPNKQNQLVLDEMMMFFVFFTPLGPAESNFVPRKGPIQLAVWWCGVLCPAAFSAWTSESAVNRIKWTTKNQPWLSPRELKVVYHWYWDQWLCQNFSLYRCKVHSSDIQQSSIMLDHGRWWQTRTNNKQIPEQIHDYVIVHCLYFVSMNSCCVLKFGRFMILGLALRQKNICATLSSLESFWQLLIYEAMTGQWGYMEASADILLAVLPEGVHLGVPIVTF